MNAQSPFSNPHLDLGFARRGDHTVLERRMFSWPYVITRTFRLDRVPAHMLTVILQTSSGALHGEDRLRQRLELAPGSAAHVTTQGAAAVHRAHPGMAGAEAVSITVAPGALLEYLPEPRILFPGSALEQAIDIDCDPGGVAIVSDAFTLHDPGGRGDAFRRLQSTTTLRLGRGEPVMIDRLEITGSGYGRLGRCKAFGNVVLAAPRRRDLRALSLELTAALAAVAGLYGAASPLPADAGVGVRLAAPDLRALRMGLDRTWAFFRVALFGEEPAPRRKGS